MTDYDIIITCAATGASLSPSMSPYLPFTPEQIVAQSVEAAQAGAAIIHLHARDPATAGPTNDLAVWKQIVPEIRRALRRHHQHVGVAGLSGRGPPVRRYWRCGLRSRPSSSDR